MHSYGIFLHLYRIYLMLSHVSFLNFILGLVRSSTIAFITLNTRIFCRYFDIVNVFLGTNDNYGLETSILNLEALSDGILWLYMVLMCLYSPKAGVTYSNSQITNILLEYPIFNKFQGCLNLLKLFDWISILMFAVLILAEIPSLYIFCHVSLVIGIVSIMVKVSENENKIEYLRGVWNVIFYFTCFIMFTKYFYLLKQYDETSDLIKKLL